MKVANITLKFKKFILKNLWNFKEPHKELFTIYNEYKKYRNMFSTLLKRSKQIFFFLNLTEIISKILGMKYNH